MTSRKCCGSRATSCFSSGAASPHRETWSGSRWCRSCAAVLGPELVGAVVVGHVESTDPATGLAQIRVGHSVITASGAGFGNGQAVRLQVLARDLILATHRPTGLSVRNEIDGLCEPSPTTGLRRCSSRSISAARYCSPASHGRLRRTLHSSRDGNLGAGQGHIPARSCPCAAWQLNRPHSRTAFDATALEHRGARG
jgi:hypothetical protein